MQLPDEASFQSINPPEDMLTLEEALDQVVSTIHPLPEETVSLRDATGRISRRSIVASADIPGFDNSAMDGYAVRSSDVATASRERPLGLRLSGRVAAGETFAQPVQPGHCIRIFTGSPMPDGADAVVMQEDTRPKPQREEVEILDRVRPWENVRFRGEDVKRGDCLVNAGDRVGAGAIGLLAAAGLTTITSSRQPVVGLLATGSELVEGATPLAPGRIYESNRSMLAALVGRTGAIPQVFPLVPDSIEETQAALEHALKQCDVVVTSGGASVGELDFIKSAFEMIGGQLDVCTVAIKPGKPFLFGRFDRKLFFGLPGNPVSAFVTFCLLVSPALLRLQGATNISLPASHCVLSEPLENRAERRHFVRVVMDSQGTVRPAGTQASHILSSLAKANGLVDVPAGTVLAKGTSVRVLRLD